MNLVYMLGMLASGLALFLFGLQLLTGALKAIAGARLQTVLGGLTANRFRGLLAGAGITALLNSSTITTVLMVGFVSAGLMTLGQTVPMIMGANIGSTFTAQIIAFDVSALTPFMLAGGFMFYAFAGKDLLRQLGAVVLGLGLLFLGIQFMGDATRPLRTFQPFIDAMQNMKNPLLGILVGAIFTAVVQSSAATLGIIIALASQGLMPLEAGIAMILGTNIGTCGTALLAAIGKSAEALQVGVVHLLFNVFGVLMLVFIIPQYADFIRYISPSAPELEGVARLAAETPRQVANAHTMFSVVSTLILIWFAGPIAKLAQLIAPAAPPDDTKRAGDPIYLDDTFLVVPSMAQQRVQMELTRLGKQVLDIVRKGAPVAVGGTIEDIADLLEQNQEADRLATAIFLYIGRLSRTEHSENQGRQLIDLTQVVSGLDGIRDVVTTNLTSLSQQRLTEGIDLARLRDENTVRFGDTVIGNLEQAMETIGQPEAEKSAQVVAAKSEIEALAVAARNSILERLKLDDKSDVLSFRLASDIIAQFREVAHFTRMIARTTQNLQPMVEPNEQDQNQNQNQNQDQDQDQDQAA
ncbi:Na/Pi cotransporter family protein [Pseudorhodoplanes sp.]|uniref:Na/Pi cotransporter family protein n=1 Tax=Pseudorhodoplanes sp. TaxID=1934341 RepID=UPI003D0EF0EE